MPHPSRPEDETVIWVVGSALNGPGYPNARATINLLGSRADIRIKNIACWLPTEFHLWKLACGTTWQKFTGAARMIAGMLLSISRLLPRYKRNHLVYVPYPSAATLWLLSWLPHRWRPRCICDAYITIWDSLYQDRNLGTATSGFSRLLLRIESRALRAAEHVIADTQANASHIHQLFGVCHKRIHAFPLALDASTCPTPGTPRTANHKVRVVFIGTFVPLQGTTVIAQAIDKLRGHGALEFILIGDGQQAEEAARWLQGNPAVTWLRGWQSPQVIAEHLAQADICLGVFGGGGKAARVLPFKLYMAMAAGKAIITQQDYSLPDGCPTIPVAACPPAPEALASAIAMLARDPARRATLACQSRDYFQHYLSPQALAMRWEQLAIACAPSANLATGDR